MPSDFSVIAIVAAHNEADIIEQVVTDLITQGVHIYFLDDGSTDETKAVVGRHLGRGVLAMEDISQGPIFNWERILLRKAQLASDLDANWFIHHDADEFREGPWPGVSLKEAIRRVDGLGFNAIDFASLDFWPTHDTFRPGMDIREAFPFYSERASYDRLQVRCWKKTRGPVDLASSGGHDARFPGRNVFPLRFVLRHYPIRGQAHGERKVFDERGRRFRAEERALGWHVQYDGVMPGASFIKDPETLIRYDADAVRVALALRHRGVESLEERNQALEDVLGLERAESAKIRGELSNRTQDLERRSRELDERTRERDSLARDLDDRRRELACATEDLGRARVEIQRLASQAKDLIADLGSHATELRAAERGLRERDADLRAHQAAIHALNGQAASLFADLEAHARQLWTTERALTERDADLRAHQAAIAELHDVLRQKTIEVDDWRRTLDDSVRRIDELHRSLSWRSMAPARAIYRLFKGR